MTDRETDATLLEGWAGGDKQAGNRLLERYFDRLLVFFGPRADGEVEDLVQRTMMSCLNARGSVREASSFRAFLFRTAKNELIDHYRRRDASREQAVSAELACERTTPSQFAIGREERDALARALTRLDLELQIVIALYYWEGATQAELTEILELPLGTVKSRLRRAKEALREHLLADAGSIAADATLQSLGAWAKRLQDHREAFASGPT